MARLGHNLRRSYLEANEVLPRTYQRLIVLMILFGVWPAPLINMFHTGTTMLLKVVAPTIQPASQALLLLFR